MKITFLGTGTSQGVPVIACDCSVCNSLDFRDNRMRSSVLIELPELHLVIDTGPDFRAQMLRERVQRLDAVVYTHQHRDHTAGMDEIRSFNFKQNMDMPIYGRDQVIAQMKTEFAYIFSGAPYPGLPKVVPHTIENKSFEINGIKITPIEGLHYKLPVFGFRIKDFVYLTDVNYISKEEQEKIKGAKVFVVNALQHEPHISHYNLKEALELVEVLQPEQTYFTHISHKLGLHQEVSKDLPENVALAHDGLTFTI